MTTLTVHSSDGTSGWRSDRWSLHSSIDMLDYAIDMMRGVDTMLMGRRTYVEQAVAWPSRTGPLAEAVTAHDKVVITRHPGNLHPDEWSGSRAASDPEAEIASAVRH